MKIFTSKYLFGWAALMAMLCMVACKKGSDPKPATRTELISKNWKVQKVDETINGTSSTVYELGQSNPSVNYSAYRLNFTSATNFTLTGRDNNPISGTWSFDDSETKINFDGVLNMENVSIVELKDNSLIITYSEKDTKGRIKDVRMQLIPA